MGETGRAGGCGSGWVDGIGDSGLSKDSDESVHASGGIYVFCAKESGCESSIGDSERADPFD
jgi:hypothetical protein